MQGVRVLCVSSSKDSDLTWCRYAEGHHGIVLKISPNVDKDSKYKLFRPVSYYPSRPTLYDSALSFQEGSLFGDQEARIKAAMEKIVYSKTLEWEYEHEYRLAIPVRTGEGWNTLSYHPEEISEIYLGAKASDEWKSEVVSLAEAVNPQITIHEMFYNANGTLLARYFR
jgi:hypothetical protein